MEARQRSACFHDSPNSENACKRASAARRENTSAHMQSAVDVVADGVGCMFGELQTGGAENQNGNGDG